MWGLVDCDNFFCSCERVFHPDLNGRPIVVLSNNDGCVIALSNEAKALGIRMCLPFYQLVGQFRNLGITAFSSNHKLYGDMSARVMSVLRQEAPEIYQYSVDEAFLDLSGIEPESLKEWGEKLSAKVRRWTGIPVSIGIAPTKTLAKMASRYAKRYPGYRKCCVIATDAQRTTALSLFPIEDLWGIGRRMSSSLKSRGVSTALDFINRPECWVKEKYHVNGHRTWLELQGINAISTDGIESQRKSILTSRTFQDMISDFDPLRTRVANFAARCAAKLRQQHSSASMLTVFIESNRFRTDLAQYGASATETFPTATSATNEIVQAAVVALHRIFRPDIKFKRAGVLVSGLSDDRALQPDLFTFDPIRDRKHRTLSRVVDSLNRQLGADTVLLASQQYAATDVDVRHKCLNNLLNPELKPSELKFLKDS